jgi:hypothetical protein
MRTNHRIKTHRAALTGLAAAAAMAFPAVAEHTPSVFDAPWLGFDLG